ncbi:kinase-like domain-containing protein [Aspergillus pseudonomiae]|uniref:mitogen-activated protein kinase n=1 Tax=Aspergillus pseudonomiae TaxID=1506151 RepID=A0A5N7DKR0_9EURO|nr:kinase-like domain-containing protein [Aspergillus pseudonomiae]KAE8407036.1 kinase-like domain-containing protein [Aspergillus pseudonomiae]
MAEFNRSQVLGSVFDTTSRYINVRPVGLGAFSLVCSAYDLVRGQAVAIKKLLNPFATPASAKQTYREIKLLKQLRHENLIGLCDVFISPRTDVYLVTELLSTDLGRLLEAGPLEPQFVQYFAYQILVRVARASYLHSYNSDEPQRGLKYLHSAGVVHRDIKPSNLVIDENCDLKICDFGLSRPQDHRMTGYVSTRYYRAPEVMLTWQMYGVEMDIWSAGCVIAEMLNGKPLFPGQDPINQFYLILDVLGNPSDKFISRICTTNTVEIIRSLERREPRPLQSVIQNLDDYSRSLLERMLTLDPQERISAEEALQHPYMRMYHDPTDEPIAEQKFDWMFNGGEFDEEMLKEMMYALPRLPLKALLLTRKLHWCYTLSVHSYFLPSRNFCVIIKVPTHMHLGSQ